MSNPLRLSDGGVILTIGRDGTPRRYANITAAKAAADKCAKTTEAAFPAHTASIWALVDGEERLTVGSAAGSRATGDARFEWSPLR